MNKNVASGSVTNSWESVPAAAEIICMGCETRLNLAPPDYTHFRNVSFVQNVFIYAPFRPSECEKQRSKSLLMGCIFMPGYEREANTDTPKHMLLKAAFCGGSCLVLVGF
jgi:hypothetical protein